MHIAIDIRPIDNSSKSQHKVRGVGKYITLLKDNIQKFDKKNDYTFASDLSTVSADVYHYPYFDPFFITLPVKKHGKTVVTVHDLIPLVHPKEFPVGIKGRIKWEINKRRLKSMDAIITDSHASKKSVERIVGYKKEGIFPVYLAVDEEFRHIAQKETFGYLKKKYNLPDTFVLYVGDVTWNKNLPRIIDAVKMAGIPLVMVGKALVEKYDESHAWNRDRKIVEAQTSNDDLFIKLGFVPLEDLAGLYNLAQALVMPSLDEGFGLPVLEAMSCGCPVITSRCGSLEEVGGDAVMYADAYSASDIAMRIGMLGKDDKLRGEFQKKGIHQSAKFTLEKMVSNTVASYEALV